MAERIALVDPRVARELEALALDGASGAMEVHGSPGGTIYIDGGRVTFAESPATPGLAARLTGSWLVPAAAWSDLPDPDDPNAELGGILTGRGLIAEDELRSVLYSAALDAIMALTAPAAGESIVAWTRFTSRAWHWAGSLISIDVPSVRAEVVRRAERLASYGILAGSCPALSELRGSWAVVSPEQWTLADRIDGQSTIRELAWRNGLALHDTMERVAELAVEGLCTVSFPAEAGSPDGSTDGPAGVSPAETAAAEMPPESVPDLPTTVAGLPRRRRGMTRIHPGRRAEDADLPAAAGTEPQTLAEPAQTDLLHQLLDGLRRMRLGATPARPPGMSPLTGSVPAGSRRPLAAGPALARRLAQGAAPAGQ